MPVSVEDTIAAVASPPGAAERGIVRISGPGIRRVLSPLFESGSDWQTARLPQRHAGQMNLPALSIPLDVNLLGSTFALDLRCSAVALAIHRACTNSSSEHYQYSCR